MLAEIKCVVHESSLKPINQRKSTSTLMQKTKFNGSQKYILSNSFSNFNNFVRNKI